MLLEAQQPRRCQAYEHPIRWKVHATTIPRPARGRIGSADSYDLLAKVLAVQQSKESLRHSLDAVQHVFLEPDLSRPVPTRETLQRFIAPVPPVEHQKAVHGGP